ncbi:benzoate 4-monooxygenase cytochrome P450 [Apiospora arundinis]
MFHFLCETRDPDKGLVAYTETNLRAELSLLIVAGSDTTAISLRLAKLADEIRTTFRSADEITHGPKLLGCRYLSACIDKGMQLAQSGPCELTREVLAGGILIKGEYYPPGTVAGTVPWVDSRNEKVYGGDAGAFRPERWVLDDASEKKEVNSNRNGEDRVAVTTKTSVF